MRLKIEKRDGQIVLTDGDNVYLPSQFNLVGYTLMSGAAAVENEQGVLSVGYVEVAE